MQERRLLSLLCRAGSLLFTLPVEQVQETMRPLAVEPIAGMPSFVQGLAVIRGGPVPVIDATSLLSGGVSRPTRFVTVKIGHRCVALAVDAVVGIREIPSGSLEALPRLFQNAGQDAISAIGTLDFELALVLSSARLLPDHAWAAIESGGAPA